MGQVRRGSATTTHAIRAAIRRSQASAAELSRTYGINPKTVSKWRKRMTVEDLKTGPREPRSSVPSREGEAAVVAFRRHRLLPLDDCLYALQPSIPHLTRSPLRRCLQRQGISRLPDVGDKPARPKFRRHRIGYVLIDVAELGAGEDALEARPVKTDRADARARAEMLRTGCCTEVFVKSGDSHRPRLCRCRATRW